MQRRRDDAEREQQQRAVDDLIRAADGICVRAVAAAARTRAMQAVQVGTEPLAASRWLNVAAQAEEAAYGRQTGGKYGDSRREPVCSCALCATDSSADVAAAAAAALKDLG